MCISQLFQRPLMIQKNHRPRLGTPRGSVGLQQYTPDINNLSFPVQLRFFFSKDKCVIKRYFLWKCVLKTIHFCGILWSNMCTFYFQNLNDIKTHYHGVLPKIMEVSYSEIFLERQKILSIFKPDFLGFLKLRKTHFWKFI